MFARRSSWCIPPVRRSPTSGNAVSDSRKISSASCWEIIRPRSHFWDGSYATTHAPQVPAGLPSALLERRPDIRQSEQQLIAANARIGVARAAYFPDISLTAAPGFPKFVSTRPCLAVPLDLWTFVGTLTQPIFTAGKIRSNVRLAEAQQQESVLTYQQTIQGAFRDVSDALIAYQKTQEFRAQQELLDRSAEDAARLSSMRYQAGTTNYLEVLTNETNYLTADLGLAQARLNELLALVRSTKLWAAAGGNSRQSPFCVGGIEDGTPIHPEAPYVYL